jgi:hypothetical protein
VIDENKRENIREEINRANHLLDAADYLNAGGFYNDAVSRLYYYLFYHFRALLLSEDLEPKTHEGISRLIGIRFVKPGILDVKSSRVFSRLMKYREEADYNPAFSFSEDEYLELREEAVEVGDAVRGYLREKGYL